MRRILDIDGTVDASAPSFSDEQLIEMYRLMLRTRTYDRRAVARQRQGRIGTYPPSEGHEAAQIGAALALGPDDWVYPAYREHGVELAMGMPMENAKPSTSWGRLVKRLAKG